MSSLKRKRNLLDDKQKCEIISYAKENPQGTPQMKMNCNLELQMTVQEFVNIDKDLQTSQDASDGKIIEFVISDTSEDSQTDDADEIEEVQPTYKQVTDSLNIAIKFLEVETSTIESDMAKLFYFKGLIKKIQAKWAKQVSLDDFFKKQ